MWHFIAVFLGVCFCIIVGTVTMVIVVSLVFPPSSGSNEPW